MEIPLTNCDGCGACFYACPKGCITVFENRVEIDYEKCIYCYQCVEVCKNREYVASDRILPYLPGIDCGECGFEDCESFADEVSEEKDLERCPHLEEELVHALRLVISPDKYLSPYPIAEHTIPTKSGVFEIGTPDLRSPLLATSDYLYTVTRLMEVLSFCDISAYVAVVPSQGYCMRLAITLKTFSVESLENILSRFNRSKPVILPKQAKILNLTHLNRRVIFGPETLEELPAYIIKNRRFIRM